MAFAGAVGAQQNSLIDVTLPESSPPVAGQPGTETKPLTNERIVSLVKSGISDDTKSGCQATF